MDLETVPLDRGLSIVFALMVDEIAGAYGDRQRIRKILLAEWEKLDAQITPDEWGTSPDAQRGMAGMMDLAGQSRPGGRK